jgi:hypothetical protein
MQEGYKVGANTVLDALEQSRLVIRAVVSSRWGYTQEPLYGLVDFERSALNQSSWDFHDQILHDLHPSSLLWRSRMILLLVPSHPLSFGKSIIVPLSMFPIMTVSAHRVRLYIAHSSTDKQPDEDPDPPCPEECDPEPP